MKAPIPTQIRQTNWFLYWPVAAIALTCVACWFIQRHHRAMARNAALESMIADYTFSTEDQAKEAFSTGDFRHAAALLAPVRANASASPTTQLLAARTLECLGRFNEAAQMYSQLEDVSAMRLATFRGKKFSERMATERQQPGSKSREPLYRLHEELMLRGDFKTAHAIARKLLPDAEPLRLSTVALLKQLDPEARVTPSAEAGRLDVSIRCLEPKVLALLQDLSIGNLSVARSGLDAPRILATLDVQALDLSFNGFSDLSGVRAMPLRRLQLGSTRAADLRPLAGMPLRELDLSRTMVNSVAPLALCPLEKLNLSSTAVRDLEPMRGLELRELDLSYTRVSDLSPLSGMPLERLILSGTSVHSLKPLAGARLKSLSLAGTAIKDLAGLEKMPLTELDLRGCELLGDLDVLRTCPQLTHVYLPRHIRIPEDRWGLPQLTVVQAEQPMVALK